MFPKEDEAAEGSTGRPEKAAYFAANSWVFLVSQALHVRICHTEPQLLPLKPHAMTCREST